MKCSAARKFCLLRVKAHYCEHGGKDKLPLQTCFASSFKLNEDLRRFLLSPFEIENFCHVSTEQQQTLKVINSCSRFARPHDFITSLHSLVFSVHHHSPPPRRRNRIIPDSITRIAKNTTKKSMTAVKIMKSDGKFIDRPGFQ